MAQHGESQLSLPNLTCLVKYVDEALGFLVVHCAIVVGLQPEGVFELGRRQRESFQSARATTCNVSGLTSIWLCDTRFLQKAHRSVSGIADDQKGLLSRIHIREGEVLTPPDPPILLSSKLLG